jgi:diacylglycerol O-acyltransferase
MAESLARTAEEDKPPVWAQAYSRHPTVRREAPAQGLIQQLASAARAGRDILPGVASGLWDIVRTGEPDSANALPFHAPPTPFNVEISGSRRFAAQSYSLARLKRIGEAAGATVNDVTLAICAGALRKYLEVQKALPRKPLIAMVPVSLHGETEAGGNQVSLLLANLATNLRDPLKRLQRIVQSTTQAKQRLKAMPRLQKMAHGITSISPMGAGMVMGTSKQRPGFNVVISNVPGPRYTLYLNGARLDEVYPVSIPTHYLALNITISGYGDNLGFGYIACRRSVPALQRMLDYTDESILELEQALADKLTPAKPAPVKTAARKRLTASRARP